MRGLNAPGFLVLPNYAERRRYGERVSTGFVESAINTVVGKRFDKRQQMRWSKGGAHLMSLLKWKCQREGILLIG